MLLLDTCTLIWIAEDQSRLSEAVRSRLSAGSANPPLVSAISAFEVAIKWHKGKLKLPSDPQTWFAQVVREYGLSVEPITWEDGIRAALLPHHHNGPMDRFIVATAARVGAAVITPDPLIARYSEIQTIW